MVLLGNGEKYYVATENDAECLLCQPLNRNSVHVFIYFIHTTNLSWCDYYPISPEETERSVTCTGYTVCK